MDDFLNVFYSLTLPKDEPLRGWWVIGGYFAVALTVLTLARLFVSLFGRVKALERRLDPFAADPAATRMGVRAPEVP